MKNLASALTGKTLADLTPVQVTGSVSNLLEPTKAEIELIMAALKAGKSHKEIKMTIRRDVNGAKPGFSYGQIKQIELAMKVKVTELTPLEEVTL